MEDQEITYFQYHTDEDYPIYLSFENFGDDGFADSLANIVEQMNFRQMSGNEIDLAKLELSKNSFARMLKIKPASFKVARQIDSAAHSDRYGLESILPKEGYKVYRYKGQALLVYSYAAEAWECGITDSFGENEEGIFAARTVLNRFLSWALAPLGVIGFWGVPVKEGLVVLRQKESQGEVVFFDLNKKKILSMDGVKSIPSRLKIMRLDNKLKNRNILMSSEELMSFLSVHTSFLDPEGHSLPIRQLLQAVSRRGEGLIHPRESFQPRKEATT
ncbi:MAG: hypothetical protein K9K67_00445 [Bacteriovoracaceae bacterium]|nr:hypothetical protein [Bacteriovoracaceae bacterium]